MEPAWARDGRQLYYFWEEKFWASDNKTAPTLDSGKPRLLFEFKGIEGSIPIRGYDIWPDGGKFLLSRWERAKASPVTKMMLVQNWLEGLGRLVPSVRK